MLKQRGYIKYLFKVTILLLAMYMLCRILFVVFNVSNLRAITYSELFTLFSQGLRFDLTTIIMMNLFFYVGWLLPFKFREHPNYHKSFKWLFIAVNSIALASNCVDLVYFKYTNKRLTADIFSYITTGNDFFRLLPLFLLQFWYVVLLFALFIYLLYRFVSKLTIEQTDISNKKYYISHSVFLLILIGPLIVGFRGGFQKKPIGIFSAGEYTSSENIPIITNTPFCIIKSAESGVLNEKNYVSDIQINQLINPLHHYKTLTPTKKNVVVLILESFSKEFIGKYNKKGFTPFLDSIMDYSITFDRCFANGKRSIEGIPAILASLPTLMDNGYVTSTYGSNTLHGFASILQKEGYTTDFYHGGENGSMGFDVFSRVVGFERYHGKNEYPYEGHYDGNWGIWDEEYLQYVAEELNKTKEPFLSTVFTLSSHHPYSIPDKYKNIYKEPGYVHNCILYTDHTLKLFFDRIKNTSWFKNTLFVLVADHTGISFHPYYSNQMGYYSIPLIFYDPSSPVKKTDHRLAQQLDVLPSMMHLLGYNKPFYSLGHNLFDSLTNNNVVKYSSPNYEMITDSMFYVFDGEKIIASYNYHKDSLLLNSISNKVSIEKDEVYLKSYIQYYNHALITNNTRYSDTIK